MDPSLWEVLEGNPSTEVAVLVRLQRGAEAPDVLRVVARFGAIVTARVRRGDVLAARAHPAVASMKAARELRPDPAFVPARIDPAKGPARSRRNPWLGRREGPSGNGSVVGVIDWGLDVAHPNFLRRDGGTRLLALWDQRARRHAKAPAPYGYGRVFTRAAIDAALRTGEPFRAMGYDPADADSERNGTHGTHVLDIAAGVPRRGPGGVAPGADLVFVHLATETTGPRSIGNSVSLLEAVDFISTVAAERPCVINLSLGSHAGPHDGSTLCEQALDAFVTGRPGRAIVQSAGNYRNRPVRATGHLRTGEHQAIEWLISAEDETTNELDLWYPGNDRVAVRLVDDGGRTVVRATPDSHGPIVAFGETVGRFAHRTRDPNNGDNHVAFVLEPAGVSDRWQVVIEPLRIESRDPRWYAWIERDEVTPGSQSRLAVPDIGPGPTTGTIANGRHTIVVGAVDPKTGRKASFSSEGPTRDGRAKPDILAPGVRIVAARSAPLDDDGHDLDLTRKTGTSMAAPHVTGTIALLYEAAGRPLSIGEIRDALGIETPASTLDIPASVARARTELTSVAAPTGYAAAIFDAFTVPSRHVTRFALPAFELVAEANAAPSVPIEPGDLLVERALGEGNIGAIEVIAPQMLMSAATPRHDRIVVRRKTTRQTAWRFASRERGRALVVKRRSTTRPHRATTRGLSEAIGGYLDAPPTGKIEVGRRGLFLRVGYDIEYVAGLDKTEQVLASWVRTLVGDAYTPLLVEELRGKLDLSITNLEGAAKANEKMSEDRGGFGTTTAWTGLEIIRWLRDTRGLRIFLDESRLRRLEHACAVELAWNEVYAQTEAAGTLLRSYETSILPTTRRYYWVTKSLFTDIAWSLGPLVEALRAAMLAFEAKPGKYGSTEFDDRNTAMQALWEELNKGADALDAIRDDDALQSHAGYAYVFPELIEAPPPKRAGASLETPQRPDGHAGRLRFIEVCLARYPDLARKAKERANARARRQLLDQFTADFKALIAWSSGSGVGDDALQQSIAEANAPPFPSYLRVNPEGPAFPTGAELHAEISIRADHWTSLWDYRYGWDFLRIDEQGVHESTLSRWTMFGRRLSREMGYTWTDYQRLRREMEFQLGPPGVGPESIAGSLAIIRFVGTAIKDIFRAIFERPYEKSLVLPGPGLYVIRCVAGDPDRDGSLLRVPSAAYQLLLVMEPKELSRRRADAALESLRTMALDVPTLIAAIESGLLEPEEIETARADLEQAHAVLRGDAASLYALQRANLEKALTDDRIGRSVSGDAKEEIKKRLSEIDRITKERTRRLSAVKGQPYRVIAVLVTDLGPTLSLMIEAVDVKAGEDGVSVLVVDSTAKHSGFEQTTAKTRMAAIRAALRSLLENKVTGYGRGYCTILVPTNGVTGVGAHGRDTFRVDLDSTSLMTEMIEGGALIISVLALLAAPFTGGASLAILIPVGVIGAIPSAYRLVKRNEEGTFAWDMETALDLVNIASAFFGVGQTGSGALKLTRMAKVFQIAGHGGDGLGILLGKVEFFEQLEAIAHDDSLLPGQKRLAMAMAVANNLLNDGVMVGHTLAMRTYGQMLKERMDPNRYPLAKGVLLEDTVLPPIRERSLPTHLEPVSKAMKVQARGLVGRDVVVLRDPSLPGKSAEVRYVLDAYGFIRDVYIVLGKHAGVDQLPSHAATAKQLFKFTGVLGKARTLIDWARAFFARDPSLKVGKARAWEARVELEKLPKQVSDYMRGVGKGLADGTIAPADVDAYIRGLFDQMAEHEARLRDASAPLRRIAAEDRSNPPPRSAREMTLEDGRQRALAILGIEPGALTVRDAPAQQSHLSVGGDGTGRVEVRVPARAPDGSPITPDDIVLAVREHADLAAQRPADLSRPDPAKPWDAAREARYRGYPDAEPGYRWQMGHDGTLSHLPDDQTKASRPYDRGSGTFRTGHVPGLFDNLPRPAEHVDKAGGKHSFVDQTPEDGGHRSQDAWLYYKPPSGGVAGDRNFAHAMWRLESDKSVTTLVLVEIEVADVPSKITGMSPELTPDGTPTQAYLSMRAIHDLARARGATPKETWSKFRVSQVEEIRSVCELAAARKRQPSASLDALVLELHAASYPRTPLEQLGFELANARVVGGRDTSLRELLTNWSQELVPGLEQVAKRSGIGLDEQVLVGFDIEFDLVLLSNTKGMTQ